MADPRRIVTPHGVYHRYSNHGCRCERCTKAWADYCRTRDWKVGRHKPWAEHVRELRSRPLPEHGTESRYTRYRCRCEECRKASREARARRRAKAAA